MISDENIKIRKVIDFSSLQEVILLHLDLLYYCLEGLFTFENGISQGRIFLLQHFELSLDLISCFGHLSGNHGEVAAIFSEERDQGGDLGLGPVGQVVLVLDDFLLFFLVEFILESDLVDDGGEGRNRGLSAGILMTVVVVNSHAEDITDRI